MIRPLSNHVLIEPIEEVLSSFQTESTSYLKGKVLAKGKQCGDEFEVGDTVLYERLSTDVKDESGQVLHMVKYLNLTAVV